MTHQKYPLRISRASSAAPVFRAYRQRRHPRLLRGNESPPSVDLRPLFPPVPSGGDVPCDTAAALVAMLQYEDPRWTGSRLFLYYNERVVEGCEREDLGRWLADGVEALVRHGACPEASWPFRVDQVDVQPPNACYAEADGLKQRMGDAVYSLPNDMASMKRCLAAGWPFLVGVAVYPSWERVGRGGTIGWPTGDALGGTAMVCLGYDDRLGVWRMRGRRGEVTLPYRYLLDSSLSTELWVVTGV